MIFLKIPQTKHFRCCAGLFVSVFHISSCILTSNSLLKCLLKSIRLHTSAWKALEDLCSKFIFSNYTGMAVLGYCQHLCQQLIPFSLCYVTWSACFFYILFFCFVILCCTEGGNMAACWIEVFFLLFVACESHIFPINLGERLPVNDCRRSICARTCVFWVLGLYVHEYSMTLCTHWSSVFLGQGPCREPLLDQ